MYALSQVYHTEIQVALDEIIKAVWIFLFQDSIPQLPDEGPSGIFNESRSIETDTLAPLDIMEDSDRGYLYESLSLPLRFDSNLAIN